MGYLYNHLATLVCAVFASVLTLLWPMFVDFAQVLDIFFIMAVPIMWFLTIVCFVAQRSADWMHGQDHSHKSAKKLVYTSDGKTTNEKS
jgi:apolipoprotein N-acyltransferase